MEEVAVDAKILFGPVDFLPSTPSISSKTASSVQSEVLGQSSGFMQIYWDNGELSVIEIVVELIS